MGDEVDDVTKICLEVISMKCSPNLAFEKLLKLVNKNDEISSILLDILVQVEGEIDGCADVAKSRSAFLNFANCLIDTIIPEEVLRAELECYDATKQEFTKQLIRFKTRFYFKQAKFNLLREESEGYSKLITELLEAENSTNEEHSKVVKTRVLALIGQFNLDPNRVTDIILECFENCPKQKHFFISLLKEINAVKEYLCAILGFKYTFYQGINKKTPFSLYILTAALIQSEMIDLMKILAYLVPKTDAIKDGHRARMANAQERSSKAETISTASMPISDMRSLDENAPSTAATQTISFTTVTQIQEDDDLKLADKFLEENVLATNQKLGLACALLESGNWKQAQLLIDRLPENYAVQASPRICRALCRIIERSIDDFYSKNCSKRLFGDLLKKKRTEDFDAANGLKMIDSWEDLGKLSSVLWYLGPRIAYRASTNVKVLRLLVVYFQKIESKELEKVDKLYRLFVDITSECLLPSLTLSETNVGLSEEIWQLMQLFPYTWRYWMYSKWNQETARHPEMNVMRGKIYGRTKYVLKRLSKDTVKMMGRQLGKLCHIHPTTVLSYLLSSVQTFDNLIGPVVEGLRFLSGLEFDILTYCIINQLSDPSKQALKASDATLSPWLQALGTLVGQLYRRYPLELAGMLDYVLNQLKCCKSFDLLLLREIIQNMSWIESSAAATKEQLEALGGGEILRQEGGGYSTAKNKRAAQRLRDALLKGDLAVGLCILIAQQKDYIVNKESDNLPLKLIGEMVDQCGDTLQQLVAFLTSYLKNDDYSRRFPDARQFLTDFGLPVETAMCLARPGLMNSVMEGYDGAKKKRKAENLEEDGTKNKLDGSLKTTLFNSVFDAKIDELTNYFVSSIPDLEEKISKKLFTVFWTLTNFDIEVPVLAYERTIEQVKKQAKEDDHGRLKRGEDRLRQIEGKLKEEQKKQTEHVERVRAWLTSVKDSLFEEKTKGVPESFLQLCILPRVLFSEHDALFCGTFFFLLYRLRTPFFQPLSVMDRILDNIVPYITGLSENEANSFARFVEILLSQAQKWHSEKEIFQKECHGFPGMITKNAMEYETYRRVCWQWQQKLQKTFTTILSKDDTDYVTIRNCLIVMTKLTTCFPLMASGVHSMENVAVKVRDREKGKRDDLSLKAASYVGRLKMRNVKIYPDSSDFASLVSKKPTKKVAPTANDTQKTKEENGEPLVKKSKIEKEKEKENGTSTTTNEVVKEKTPKPTVETNGTEKSSPESKEDGKDKKKRPAKTELYVPRKKVEKEKPDDKEEKKQDEGPREEGEVNSPSPPPIKKSRLADRIKRTDKDEEDERKSKKEEKRGSKDDTIRIRKIGAPHSDQKKSSNKKDKENKEGREKSREHKKAREEREIAGPTLPERSRSKDRNSRKSEDRKEKEREKERKEHVKISKIAEAPVKNKEKRSSR